MNYCLSHVMITFSELATVVTFPFWLTGSDSRGGATQQSSHQETSLVVSWSRCGPAVFIELELQYMTIPKKQLLLLPEAQHVATRTRSAESKS